MFYGCGVVSLCGLFCIWILSDFSGLLVVLIWTGRLWINNQIFIKRIKFQDDMKFSQKVLLEAIFRSDSKRAFNSGFWSAFKSAFSEGFSWPPLKVDFARFSEGALQKVQIFEGENFLSQNLSQIPRNATKSIIGAYGLFRDGFCPPVKYVVVVILEILSSGNPIFPSFYCF